MSKLVKNLKKFKLVTFDVTDTLLQFSLPPAVQYAKTAAQFGFTNIEQHQLNQSFRTEFKKMAKKYPNFGSDHCLEYRKWWFELVCNIFDSATCRHNKIPAEHLEKIATKLIRQYRTTECWQQINGASVIVEKIKNLGKSVGVISNFDPSLSEIVTKMDLPDFDFILTSYECGHMKPHKNIFSKALTLSKIECASDAALHIGNTFEIDYVGAHESGWSCLLISDDARIRNDSRLKHQSHMHENLKTLLNNLENHDIQW